MHQPHAPLHLRGHQTESAPPTLPHPRPPSCSHLPCPFSFPASLLHSVADTLAPSLARSRCFWRAVNVAEEFQDVSNVLVCRTTTQKSDVVITKEGFMRRLLLTGVQVPSSSHLPSFLPTPVPPFPLEKR